MSRCGLSRSAIVVAVVVGGVSSGCELKPDPNKHAQVAAMGSNPAPPPNPARPSPAPPPEPGPPPDAALPVDAGTDGGPARGEDPVKPPVDAKLEGRVLARCVAQKSWAGHAFFHTQNTPFSVMVGSPNHWKWVSRSSPSDNFPHQVEVPLNSLLRATGVAGLTPSIQVFVVSGSATDQDAIQDTDDDTLNHLIYEHQHPRTGTSEIVRVAHDYKGEGKPVIFDPTPSCITRPRPGTHVTDPCATPLCPK